MNRKRGRGLHQRGGSHGAHGHHGDRPADGTAPRAGPHREAAEEGGEADMGHPHARLGGMELRVSVCDRVVHSKY